MAGGSRMATGSDDTGALREIQMKASVFTSYGPPEVLKLTEVAKPVPGDEDVLVRVRATSVNFGDTLVRDFRSVSPSRFHMPFLFWLIGRISFGWLRPRTTILGSEFAGDVEAVGRKVTRFKAGDRVFGYRGSHMGAYAEYLCVPDKAVMAPMPANLTYEEAASIPYGAIMALELLRKLKLQPGQRVLVVGAAGGIGHAIVQIASAHFRVRVSGVCGPSGVESLRSLGAEQVIDYTREDFVERAEVYDVIIDVLGKSSFARCRRVLAPNGRLVFVSFKMRQILQMLRTRFRKGQKVICALMTETSDDLIFIKGLIEAGTLRPSIGRTFPLEQAAAAHRYAESPEKRGNVAITVP